MKPTILICFMALIFSSGYCFAEVQIELTELVSIKDLKPNSRHAYKKLIIEGWVREVKLLKGRLGSGSLHLVVGEGDSEIDVFQYPIPILGDIKGQRVIVKGEYIPHGRFGGFLQNAFIKAELIERDWHHQGEK